MRKPFWIRPDGGGVPVRLLVVGVALVAAFFAGLGLRGCWGSGPAPQEGPAEAGETVESATTWTCSMHPQIRSPKPGLCPICAMDLIPVDEGDGADEGGGLRTLTLSETAKALLDIQTSPVERRFVNAEIRMTGKVDYDETRLGYITAWVGGRIDRLYVDYTGIRVDKGDHMVYLYSPELLTAQEELRRAARAVDTMSANAPAVLKDTARSTLEAARSKLKRWGLTDEQIRQAEEQGTLSDHVTIYAPLGGTVIERRGQEGMYVETGTQIYTIADLREVWVKLDAYESDLPWLHYGQTVSFTTDAHPGEVFEGRISFIDPVLNPTTRTVSVRVNVPNPDGLLKPEMFVRAVVRAQVATGGRVMDASMAGKWISPMHPEIVKDGPGACDVCGMALVPAETLGYVAADAMDEARPLVIPASAPLITGTRAVVYVERTGADRRGYEGREIILGPRAGDYYLVKHGLREGQRVVTHGNFNIDSALQIQAKPSMMTPDVADFDLRPADAAPLRPVLAVLEDLAGLGDHDHTAAQTLAQRLRDAIASVDEAALAGDAGKVWYEFAMRLDNDAYAILTPRNHEAADQALAHLEENAEALRALFRLPAPGTSADLPDSAQGAIAPVFEAYLAISEALANDDAAADAGMALERALAAFDAATLPGPARRDWDALRRGTEEHLDTLQSAADMDAAREAFHSVSGAFIEWVSIWGAPDGLRFQQVHCPMAFDGAGADWLQRGDAIRNPYFGAAMLNCGTVEQVYGGNHAGHTTPATAAPVDLGPALDAYLAAAEALASDDEAGAREHLEALTSAEDAGADLKEAAAAASATDSMSALRTAFERVSRAAIALARDTARPGGPPLHIAHCPMALDNQGADWLQTSEAIRNPYYGAMMLACGSITETLGGGGVHVEGSAHE